MKDEVKKLLLSSAATSLEFACYHHAVPATNPKKYAPGYPELQELGKVFVSLYRNGQLAGCMGSLEPRRNLWEDVKCNTFSASRKDLRFSPVASWQLNDMKIGISVLGAEHLIQVSEIESSVADGYSIVVNIPNTPVKAMLLNFAARWAGKASGIIETLRKKAGIADRLTDQELNFYAVETCFFEEKFVNIPKLKLGV
jgi:AMMECR1 domain-containing protein